MIELVENTSRPRAQIRVIGIGGGGGNAVNNMIASGMSGVEFVAVNTDAQDLDRSLATRRFQLGGQLTKGIEVAKKIRKTAVVSGVGYALVHNTAGQSDSIRHVCFPETLPPCHPPPLPGRRLLPLRPRRPKTTPPARCASKTGSR